MMFTLSTQVPAREWDAFIESAPTGHLLQTTGWGELKRRYGWEVERVGLRQGERLVAGFQMLFRRLPLGTMAYVPRGPVWSPPMTPGLWLALDRALRETAAGQRALLLRVEPNSVAEHPVMADRSFEEVLGQAGYRRAKGSIQPTSTIILSLANLNEDELLKAMKSKTRYNIRLAQRKDVKVRMGDERDLPAFYRLTVETGERDNFGVHQASYYEDAWRIFSERQQVGLFVAEYQGAPLATLMAFACGKQASYLYGASANAGRHLMPNYLLQWETIRWAAFRGCETYDFWGIPADIVPEQNGAAEEGAEDGNGANNVNASREGNLNVRDGLWGVYRFKLGFGGKVVQFTGAYERAFYPGVFWALDTLAPRLRRMPRLVPLVSG
ncbi:MAG: peptidoglycan bridge formation glycyltransferase FemA/FemB family protein [Chloroflexi bacterium]|nr:peptidoglycan bridge formation glycyltransferase FemA/FemB family protein [Chloroflexota bacterium]